MDIRGLSISQDYQLKVDGNYYPPKYIISVANNFANGKNLSIYELKENDEANNFQQSKGFDVTKIEVQEEKFNPI